LLQIRFNSTDDGVFVDLNYKNRSADKSRSRSLEKDVLDLTLTGEVSAEVEITEFFGTVMGQSCILQMADWSVNLRNRA
jgi:hypothetical protein